MKRTYNVKYPQKPLSDEQLLDIRDNIGQIERNKFTRKEIEEKFGSVVNFFYFGIYTVSLKCIGDDSFCHQNEKTEIVTDGNIMVEWEQEKFRKNEKIKQ